MSVRQRPAGWDIASLKNYTHWSLIYKLQLWLLTAKGVQPPSFNPLSLLVRPAGREPAACGYEDRTLEFPNLLID
jgi:hypothetical protein